MKCENCGAETDASINGRPFCIQKACIEATVRGATAAGRLVRKLVAKTLGAAPTEGEKT